VTPEVPERWSVRDTPQPGDTEGHSVPEHEMDRPWARDRGTKQH